MEIQQGARDSIHLAINALERSRDAREYEEFVDTLATAIDLLGQALTIQRVSSARHHDTTKLRQAIRDLSYA